MTTVTDPNFWDCECQTRFIHAKTAGRQCAQCWAEADSQPDSHASEIARGLGLGNGPDITHGSPFAAEMDFQMAAYLYYPD